MTWIKKAAENLEKVTPFVSCAMVYFGNWPQLAKDLKLPATFFTLVLSTLISIIVFFSLKGLRKGPKHRKKAVLFCILLALLIGLSLYSYYYVDDAWKRATNDDTIHSLREYALPFTYGAFWACTFGFFGTGVLALGKECDWFSQ